MNATATPHLSGWLLALCALAPLAQPAPAPRAPASATAPEWPTHWQGQPLRPLAPSAVERRFAARFPGHLARFATADAGELVLREVHRPTRLLHPAADCWRGIGWQVGSAQLEHDASNALWRCFEAGHDGQRVRVCERIVGHDGSAFTDASAWFWAASLGHSHGPWRAVTRVQPL